MIHDLDRPFDGINRIEPTELARSQAFVEGNFAQRFAGDIAAVRRTGVGSAPFLTAGSCPSRRPF